MEHAHETDTMTCHLLGARFGGLVIWLHLCRCGAQRADVHDADGGHEGTWTGTPEPRSRVTTK